MKMTIMRAVERLEMDVDASEQTEVAHIEWDDYGDGELPYQMTIYGTEKNGELWYIVLDKEVVQRIIAVANQPKYGEN